MSRSFSDHVNCEMGRGDTSLATWLSVEVTNNFVLLRLHYVRLPKTPNKNIFSMKVVNSIFSET